jgi:hypothetical protein
LTREPDDADFKSFHHAAHTPSTTNRLDASKLGWNLPVNDIHKAGKLDQMSVDSYFVGDKELDEIEKQKKLDPINPNYRVVYDGLIERVVLKVSTNVNSNTAASSSSNEPVESSS